MDTGQNIQSPIDHRWSRGIITLRIPTEDLQQGFALGLLYFLLKI